MAKKIPEYSIILPCLNEEATLAVCIEKIKLAFESLGVNYEVIVADNGSVDGSLEIVRKKGVKLVKVVEKGYGAALQGGFSQAKGKYLIMGDSDNSYDFSEIGPFVKKLEQGYQFVIGNRFSGNMMPGAMPWLNKYIGNPILTFIGRLLFNSDISDFHCGLRGMTRNAWQEMDLQTTGMEYATEMVIKANYLKLKYADIPITYYPDGRNRAPNLRRWRDGWRHLRFMLLFAPNWLYLYPGIIFGGLGSILFLLVLFKPFYFFNIVLDVHTLLVSSMMIIIAVQIIFFGLISKIYIVKTELLPFQKPFIKFNLEIGLLTGFVFIILGSLIFLMSFFIWYKDNFGPLNYSVTLRIVIPSMLLIQLGIQILFNSFFLGLLTLPIKRKVVTQ